ncbi:MAG TPA: GatB/YqeY domain-containing protein [Aggregatilineales bacterium]|nr:GatB/YqeY domain-containing protein [Aggregatilineales bacterium]
MNPKEQIQADLTAAMKARDTEKRDALRLLTAAIKQVEVDQRKELSEEDVYTILQKEAKRREESITELENAGRDASSEKAELTLIESYLPEQLDRAEIEAEARNAIAESGASTAKDTGNVMKILMPRLKNRADGKLVSEVVRELLS